VSNFQTHHQKFNKKAQLSLGKTRYNLYSFCCSTDLEGHPRSTFVLSGTA